MVEGKIMIWRVHRTHTQSTRIDGALVEGHGRAHGGNSFYNYGFF